MSSNTTTKPKKKNGAPNHKVLYDSLQLDIAKVRKQHSALQTTFADGLKEMDRMTREIAHQAGQIKEAEHLNSQLEIEARRSLENLKEMKYHRKWSRAWCACSVILCVSIIALAVSI